LVLVEGAASFEQVVLIHMDAAYNLARWLTRNESDAQDVVQDACVRAFRGFATFRGGDSRAWLLTIVRNVALTFLRTRRQVQEFEEDLQQPVSDGASSPQMILLRAADAERVRAAIDLLPLELRTAIVLREMEGLAYKEIAGITGVPIGTVMSRLSRGRERLAKSLAEPSDAGEQP
jgi:RNA polymerase sigma-70 factor (ECF subfamily)